MRHLLALAALAALPLVPAPALAQSSTPRVVVQPGSDGGSASDANWSPQAYGLATAGAPAALSIRGLGTGTGTPGTVITTQPPPPPQPTVKGKWVGNVQCDGTLQVCGYASQSRGWGFAVWNQHWECSCDVCDPLPATVAASGAACQTSMGNLGYIFGPQCYVGSPGF